MYQLCAPHQAAVHRNSGTDNNLSNGVETNSSQPVQAASPHSLVAILARAARRGRLNLNTFQHHHETSTLSTVRKVFSNPRDNIQHVLLVTGRRFILSLECVEIKRSRRYIEPTGEISHIRECREGGTYIYSRAI